MLSVAVAVTTTVPETVAPSEGEEMETVGGITSSPVTVTFLRADAEFPAASYAVASIVWFPRPSPEGGRVASNGALVSCPTPGPSRKNSTRRTPTLSDAVAVTGTEPETIAPSAGEEMETDGAVTSRTVTVSVSVSAFPSASRTVSVTTYVPGVAQTGVAVAPGG